MGRGLQDSDKHKLFPAKIVRVEERHEFGNARRSRKEAGLLAELAEEAADLVSDEPEDKLWMTLAEYSKHKGLWDSVQPKKVTPDAGGGGGADGADDDEEEIEADDDAQKVGSKSTLAAAVASQFKTRVFVQDITVKSKNSTGDVVKKSHRNAGGTRARTPAISTVVASADLAEPRQTQQQGPRMNCIRAMWPMVSTFAVYIVSNI